jgi:hypothetical protein
MISVSMMTEHVFAYKSFFSLIVSHIIAFKIEKRLKNETNDIVSPADSIY